MWYTYLLFVLFTALNLADVYLTEKIISTGVGREANKLMLRYMEWWGDVLSTLRRKWNLLNVSTDVDKVGRIIAMVSIKLVSIVVFGLVAFFVQDIVVDVILALLVLVYVWVVWNNYNVLKGK